MEEVGLQQRPRVVRVVLEHDAIVIGVEGLLILHEPGADDLSLPNIELAQRGSVDVVAKAGAQPRGVALPGDVQVGREYPVVQLKVGEEAALGGEGKEEPCICTRAHVCLHVLWMRNGMLHRVSCPLAKEDPDLFWSSCNRTRDTFITERALAQLLEGTVNNILKEDS